MEKYGSSGLAQLWGSAIERIVSLEQEVTELRTEINDDSSMSSTHNVVDSVQKLVRERDSLRTAYFAQLKKANTNNA